MRAGKDARGGQIHFSQVPDEWFPAVRAAGVTYEEFKILLILSSNQTEPDPDGYGFRTMYYLNVRSICEKLGLIPENPTKEDYETAAHTVRTRLSTLRGRTLPDGTHVIEPLNDAPHRGSSQHYRVNLPTVSQIRAGATVRGMK